MFLSPGGRARQQSFFSLLLRRQPRQGFSNPVDGVELHARRRAGRFMLGAIGPSNNPYELQPYIGGNKCAFISANGASATTASQFGWAAATLNGTATARAVATTSLLASTRRLGAVLASAAVNLKTGWEFNGATAFLWRGNAAGLGGFYFHGRFGFNALTAGNRHMIGLSASVTTTADPSTATDCAFVGKDAADTNFQVMFNDASGTATKVDTGIAPTTDKLYDVTVFAPPNGTSIKIELRSYDNTGQVDGYFEYEATTNLPTNTTLMAPRMISGSGTATTGAAIDSIQAYVETDF